MRLFAALLVSLLLVLGLAACGGDDDEADDQPPPAQTGDAGADGRQVFTQNCASCHTLDDAGASATIGPNLDDLQPSQEQTEQQVREGGGGMPAFEGRLTDEEIEAVAQYVAESAGG